MRGARWSAIVVVAGATGAAMAQSPLVGLDEGFDSVPALFSGVNPWARINRSEPAGLDPVRSAWRQGEPATFSAQAGNPAAYALVTFHSAQGTGTVSNWLITPTLLLNNGDVLSFSTRTVSSVIFPDRMQVRLSTAAESLDVGAGASDVGDFSTLLLELNPNQVDAPSFSRNDPEHTTYPNVWTDFTLIIGGLSGPTVGRVGFRYVVDGGGTTGEYSQAIGLDSVRFTPVPTPGVSWLLAAGAGVLAGRRRR